MITKLSRRRFLPKLTTSSNNPGVTTKTYDNNAPNPERPLTSPLFVDTEFNNEFNTEVDTEVESQFDTELWARIAAFTFDPPNAKLTFAKRLIRETGWSGAYAAQAINEYRRFLYLAVRAGHAVTPSQQVDEVWHLHLMYTRHYWGVLCADVLRTPCIMARRSAATPRQPSTMTCMSKHWPTMPASSASSRRPLGGQRLNCGSVSPTWTGSTRQPTGSSRSRTLGCSNSD
jgi:hypothetical protein